MSTIKKRVLVALIIGTVFSSQLCLLAADEVPGAKLPTITVSEQAMAEKNKAGGEKWEVPIKLGDTREHVYDVLGNPANKADPSIADWWHLSNNQPGVEVEYWRDQGLTITFTGDQVSEILLASPQSCQHAAIKSSPFTNEVVFGIHPGDDLATMYSKLGPPYKINCSWGTKVDGFYLSSNEVLWRIGNYDIDASFGVGTTDYRLNGPPVFDAVGASNGPLIIKDISKVLKADEDAQYDRDLVKLSGNKLTPDEIFTKYKNRIFTVTAYSRHGMPISTGTGFQINDSVIVTSYVTVQDARKITVKSILGDTPEVEVFPYWYKVDPLKGFGLNTVAGDKAKNWVALCRGLINFNNGNYPSSDLKPLPTVETADHGTDGDQLTVLESEDGADSIKSGIISKTSGAKAVISVPPSPKSLGSPVFDSTGRWLGLISGANSDLQEVSFLPASPDIYVAISAPLQCAVTLPLHDKYTDKSYLALGRLDGTKDKTSSQIQEEIQLAKNLWQAYPNPDDRSDILGTIIELYANVTHNYVKALALSKERTSIDSDNYAAWEQQAWLLGYNMHDTTNANVSMRHAIGLAERSISGDLDKLQKNLDDSKYQGESNALLQQSLESYRSGTNDARRNHLDDAWHIALMYAAIGDKGKSDQWLQTIIEWTKDAGTDEYKQRFHKCATDELGQVTRPGL